jgi:hypothetical protein
MNAQVNAARTADCFRELQKITLKGTFMDSAHLPAVISRNKIGKHA